MDLNSICENEAERRLRMLGNTANEKVYDYDGLKNRAQQVGIPVETLIKWWRSFLKDGLEGLKPQDWGELTQEEHEGAIGIYSLIRDLADEETITKDQIEELAVWNGWSVRVTERWIDRYRSGGLFGLSPYHDPLKSPTGRVICHLDFTQVDLLVKDGRKKDDRTKSGEIRPWLTLAIDSASQVIMAARFNYDRPDRYDIAYILRDAMILTDTKPYGRRPDEIWGDNGKEYISKHLHQLARDLDITLINVPPHQPQQKGIVERFFRTLDTRLWSTLPGYVGSNTFERNPSVKAELTIHELEARFWDFVTQY